MKQLYNNVLFVLMGVLVFSSVCSTISSNIIHAPFTVPEVTILPFVFLLKDKFRSLRLNRPLFIRLLIISFILIFVAIIWDIFDVSSILSCARCYIYLFFGICIFDSKNNITDDDIIYLCLGSLIGWALISYSNLQYLMYERSDAYITYGMFIGIPMFISLTLSHKRYLVMACGLCFLIVIFMFAGIRRAIAVFIMSFVFYCILNVIKTPQRLFSVSLIIALLCGVFYILLPWMEATVNELSPHLYYRLFARSQDAMGSNLNSSDMTRISNLTLLSNTDTDLFLPHGFNTIRYDKVAGSGVFNDVPIFSIAWIIGLPFTVILLMFIAKMGVKTYKLYLAKNTHMALAVVVSLLCMYCLLFLDGTFMTYVYAAPFTGFCLGKIKFFTTKQLL